MTVAQYDDLDDSAITRLAHNALSLYPATLREGNLQLLCRSENATFRLIAGGKRYALRLHRERYHSKNEIESELLWLDALRNDLGITVPEAVRASDGERVLTVTDENGTVRHADLFHWIEGEEPSNSVDPASFQQLGEITARLHQHSRQWQQPAGFGRILWSHQTMVGANGHWGDWAAIAPLAKADVQLIEEVVAQVGGKLAAYGKLPDRFGLIHADLRLANLLIHEGETRVIDFDDCGFGWYFHDLAAALSFEEHHPSAPAWVENWLIGYERLVHVEDADLAILPSMLIQRRIQLTAWMASHAQTRTALKLADRWAADTVRLCGLYMDGKGLPLG